MGEYKNPNYIEYFGLHFKNGTKEEIARIVFETYQSGKKIRVHYGDIETGADYHENYDTFGTIRFSEGMTKSPLLQCTKNICGVPLQTERIIKITQGKKVLYEHETYHIKSI